MLFRDNTAVIIVDFQNEWSREESPFYLGRATLAAEKTRTLVHEAHQRKLPLFYTKIYLEEHFENAFSPVQDRSNIHEKLPKLDVINVIEHYGWDPFFETTLDKALAEAGVEHLVIGGLAINAGVRSCVESAVDRNFEVTLVEDCCSAKDSETMQFTIEDLQMYRDIRVEVLRNFEDFL